MAKINLVAQTEKYYLESKARNEFARYEVTYKLRFKDSENVKAEVNVHGRTYNDETPQFLEAFVRKEDGRIRTGRHIHQTLPDDLCDMLGEMPKHVKSVLDKS